MFDEIERASSDDATTHELVTPTLIRSLGDSRDDLECDLSFFGLVRKDYD